MINISRKMPLVLLVHWRHPVHLSLNNYHCWMWIVGYILFLLIDFRLKHNFYHMLNIYCRHTMHSYYRVLEDISCPVSKIPNYIHYKLMEMFHYIPNNSVSVDFSRKLTIFWNWRNYLYRFYTNLIHFRNNFHN